MGACCSKCKPQGNNRVGAYSDTSNNGKILANSFHWLAPRKELWNFQIPKTILTPPPVPDVGTGQDAAGPELKVTEGPSNLIQGGIKVPDASNSLLGEHVADIKGADLRISKSAGPVEPIDPQEYIIQVLALFKPHLETTLQVSNLQSAPLAEHSGNRRNPEVESIDILEHWQRTLPDGKDPVNTGNHAAIKSIGLLVPLNDQAVFHFSNCMALHAQRFSEHTDPFVPASFKPTCIILSKELEEADFVQNYCDQAGQVVANVSMTLACLVFYKMLERKAEQPDKNLSELIREAKIQLSVCAPIQGSFAPASLQVQPKQKNIDGLDSKPTNEPPKKVKDLDNPTGPEGNFQADPIGPIQVGDRNSED